MRFNAFFIVFLFASFLSNAQEPLSLSACIEQAWANNLQVKQSELNLESSESQLKSTRANALPNLNGFATHNYNWGQRIDPFTNQFATTRVQSNSFGLSAGIDLFNGFQTHQRIQSDQAALEVSKYDLEAQKNDIALSVAAGYLQVLLVEELIDAAEQQAAITKNQLERVAKLVEVGAENIGSQYELEAQFARDRSNLTQRKNDYQNAMLQLKQMMLLPADENISLEKPVVEADSTLRLENSKTVYGMAESNMPEIKRAEFSLVQWEHQLGAARSGWYPSLTLSGSIGSGYSGLRTEVESVTPVTQTIGYTESGDQVFAQSFDANLVRVPFVTQVGDNFNQFVGVSLNVPIFNRWSVQNNVNQARINRSIAELQLEQEKLGLRQRIETARTDAIAARELYKANIDALKSSSKSFEFAAARFEAGALDITAFNTAKNNLQIAQNEVSRSRYDFVFKTKILDFYMGQPLGF
ncbi:MAG: TolC family protein [Salibacteraceae bacterium]